MLDHNHAAVARIAYPAKLTAHLHELHDVTDRDVEFLTSDGLGDMHERLHARTETPSELTGELQRCDSCGKENDVAFHYCPSCGLRTYATSAVGVPVSMPTAVTLGEATDLCHRIHQGAFDRFLEDLLEATHGRKRARREMRRGR